VRNGEPRVALVTGFLGRRDSSGTIEKGKVADLLLLDGNPLDDIRNTRKRHAVVASGRFLDRAALDRLLEEAQIEASR
jgi:cytosine/adenosine deaminase-related metal-dependent hydrolase